MPLANTADALDTLATILTRDNRAALATIIETWGSAPVPIGGQMAIAADGTFAGSVSGGCVEGEVITEATELLESGTVPKTLTFGVEDETAWRVGLPCGGKIRVLVERIEGDAGRAYAKTLLNARTRRQPLVVTTNLATGARTIVADAASAGALAQRFSTGISSVDSSADSERFIHTRLPPPRVVIVGATHIGQILAELVRQIGFKPIVVDPRTAFAADTRFPGIDLVTDWPQDALPLIGLDRYTAVAALAHVGHIDDEALKLALRSESFYVGALGSKKNHAKRIERLTAAGFGTDDLARIHAPIGLDLGATTPPEIALSVMAEILRALRGTKGKGAA